MKKCLDCDKEILSGRKDKKYCNNKCANTFFKRHNKSHIKRAKAEWYLRVRDRERARSKAWYKKHRKSEILKNREYREQNRELFDWYHNKVRYNGLRSFILKRDKNQCSICQTKLKLNIHHIDGTGYATVKDPKLSNNDCNNLITLCMSCHHKLHWWQKKNHNLKSREDIVRTMVRAIEQSRNASALRK